ncbi:IclR family transcriptional regulator [Microbacterium soli]|uniref:IclR family transcriptional regulator n=1 Tax=Microbacterium soli TaxID=446075 RepID=A0ABP7N5U8_9MICO
MTNEGSTSLARAIALLSELGTPEAAQSGGFGVVQLAKLIGREKTQVSRTLAVLADSGFVLRDQETLKYRLGWRLYALAASTIDQQLLTLAPTVLRQLVARVNEAAHLSALENQQVLTLMSETPGRTIQGNGLVGRATPMYCTSAGRVLLFDHDDDEVREMIAKSGFPPGGPNAPTDEADFLSRLHDARRAGYAVVHEEYERGVVAVAAPVRDFSGRVVAAINISFPTFRAEDVLLSGAREVQAAAMHLTRTLCARRP